MPYDPTVGIPLLGALGLTGAPPVPQMMPESLGNVYARKLYTGYDPSRSSGSGGINPISALFGVPGSSLGAMADAGGAAGGVAGGMTADLGAGAGAGVGALGGADLGAMGGALSGDAALGTGLVEGIGALGSEIGAGLSALGGALGGEAGLLALLAL